MRNRRLRFKHYQRGNLQHALVVQELVEQDCRSDANVKRVHARVFIRGLACVAVIT